MFPERPTDGRWGAGSQLVFPRGGLTAASRPPYCRAGATDKWTLVIKLKEPSLPALGLILKGRHSYILGPEVIEQYGDVTDWRNVVGTGPFMFTDHVDGSSMTWTKNPDYWGFDEKYPENRLPYIDELRGLVSKDKATHLALMRSGKIDYLGFGSDLTTVDAAVSLQRTNPELNFWEWSYRSETSFTMNSQIPPFNDIRVRRAIQMAIDFETINDTYFQGWAHTTPAGKVALGAFVSELDGNRYRPLYVRGAGLSAAQLYKAILEELKIDPPFFAGQAKQLFFKTIPELAKKPVVILDDAQDLAAPALTAIKSMVNFAFDTKNSITFVLAGQPELRELLRYAPFASLRQRIRISYHMPAMALEETCRYIDHHTARCGRPTSIFADDAKADIHRHAGGVPRLVNAVCYRSILRAAVNDIRIIDSTNIVTDELDS